MANDTMQIELEKLRNEVELLREDSSPVSTDSTSEGAAENDIPSIEADTEVAGDVSSQLKELVDALEQDLENTNPLTLLIIFALGILVGRLLPR